MRDFSVAHKPNKSKIRATTKLYYYKNVQPECALRAPTEGTNGLQPRPQDIAVFLC